MNMNAQPTMPGFEDDPAVLRGDGRYGFTARIEGDDLVVRGVRATWFGGPHDPDDNGQTASGISTRLHPELLGCALPMNGFRLTRGSPLPDLPWMTTEVEIYRASNGRRLTVPLIDLGPAAPPHAHAAIDLTVAAFRALGGDPKAGDMEVCFRIPGAAHRLPADILAAVRASLREATIPTPRTAIGTARPGPVSRSPAPAAVPPATLDAARAQTEKETPAAGAAQGGTAVDCVNRSVPPSARLAC